MRSMQGVLSAAVKFQFQYKQDIKLPSLSLNFQASPSKTNTINELNSSVYLYAITCYINVNFI
jgi:hypothetical protein